MLHVIEEAEIGGDHRRLSVTPERRIQEAFRCVFVCLFGSDSPCVYTCARLVTRLFSKSNELNYFGFF